MNSVPTHRGAILTKVGGLGEDGSSTPFVPQCYAHSSGAYFGSPSVTDILPPGFYKPGMSDMGPVLRHVPVSTDSLLRLPDPTCEALLQEFVDFWDKVDQFAPRGLSVKRGLMLYGPPGSGKTSAIQLMCADMVERQKGVVVIGSGNPSVSAACLHLVRGIEHDRPIVLLLEDIDAIIERWGEADLLALLDGELQTSGIVTVATTNYPERLDDRFINRPGRFDRIINVPMPLAEARAAYFAAKAHDVSEDVRAGWVRRTEGWSIAHLRELVVAHCVLGEDEASVFNRISSMIEQKPKSDDHKAKKVGFSDSGEMPAYSRGRFSLFDVD